MTKRQAMACVGLVVAAAIAAGATLAWQADSTASTQTANRSLVRMSVGTMPAERQDQYACPRRYTGVIRGARRTELAFQRGGEIVELLADEGEHVERRHLLARLDTRHVLAAQAQLKAQHAEAQAILDELVAGPRKETIAAKQAELRVRQAECKLLEKQVARRERLVSSASVSREEYETFVHELAAAEARLDVVQRQLDELLAGTRPEQIAAGRARLAQLDARLADVSHDLQDAELTAPFAGRIARRLVDEGAVLNSGAIVFELIEDAPPEAWVGLPPRIASTIAVGDEYSLEVDGKELRATVSAKRPEVTAETRTRDVIFRIEANNTSAAVPGQVVRLAVEERVDESGFWVPTTALTPASHGLWAIYVVEQAGADDFVIARREVELMGTGGDRSFIRGTLQSGEQIVVSGAHRVVVGQHVRPTPAKATASNKDPTPNANER